MGPVDWLTDDLIEPLAIAVCYAEFLNPQELRRGPVEYWASVGPRAKREYRAAARHLLMSLMRGARLMPQEPSTAVLVAYMQEARLKDARGAGRHYRAIRRALPTIFAASVAEAA